MTPTHLALAAVAALAAAGAARRRGSRSAAATATTAATAALAARYAPAVVELGVQVVSRFTRRQIDAYLNMSREEQIKLLRRRMLAVPGAGWGLRLITRNPKRADDLAAFVEDFLREYGDDAVRIAEVIAQAQITSKVGSGNMHLDGLGQLQHLLALLRTLRWHYHTAHWRVRGPQFYGDHLMFERLYQGDPSLEKEIDSLAEKMVALYGRDAVASQAIWPEATAALKGAVGRHWCPYRQALDLEREVQSTLKSAHATLEAEGKLTPGLDDYLIALGNERDTAIYLLTQRLRNS